MCLRSSAIYLDVYEWMFTNERSIKLRGAQRFPELALGSTDVCVLENLIFSALEATFLYFALDN